MGTTQLRQRAKKAIDQLSGARLRFAADFLSYVQDRETDEATAELFGIMGFEASYARGVKDIKAGRVVDWRKIRRNVWGGAFG